MMSLKCLIYCAALFLIAHAEESCEQLKRLTGVILYTGKNEPCWRLVVPEDFYIEMKFTEVRFQQCYYTHLNVTIGGSQGVTQLCYGVSRKEMTSYSPIKLSIMNQYAYEVHFKLEYSMESLICVEESTNFRCDNNVCIHKYQKCDGVRDCRDGSDEEGCESAMCKEPNHFRCSKYVCIRKDQACDGSKDCEDGSDESSCGSTTTVCPTDQFCCSNDVCLQNYQVCNGINDCANGSDEKDCESAICREVGNFRCSRNICIHENQVCDGKKDCEDGADEKRCESDICKETIHFRCSASVCIHPDQVCDGKKDCEDGFDERGCEVETEAVKEENSSLRELTSRLLGHREPPYSWGKNAARAITALYLSGNASFLGNDLEEELMAKELELQISVALLRNVTEQMSVNDLSIFINAITVTCYNPRRFFGNDLLQTLSDRMSLTSPISGAYLTLCSSGWTLRRDATQSLLRLLRAESGYPFATDLQAITVMALSCIKNRTQHLEPTDSSANIYNSILLEFMGYQNSDGSFGNPQTTAWITQALFASGQQRNGRWNPNAALDYLKRYLKSTDDFLLTYLTLPVLKGKSLVDIGAVNCTGGYRHQADDIDDLIQKLKGNLRIKYSLYVGENKHEMHTMDLRMPNGSSVYDVMRAAHLTDQKYRFLSTTVSGYRYVYEVTGVPDDPEAGLFWLLYKRSGNGVDIAHTNESPDKITVQDEDHLVWWYKTYSI